MFPQFLDPSNLETEPVILFSGIMVSAMLVLAALPFLRVFGGIAFQSKNHMPASAFARWQIGKKIEILLTLQALESPVFNRSLPAVEMRAD
jgi:hypothetical protein